MRVLVTGASGYIARWLIPELQSRNYEVLGTDSQSYFGGDLDDKEFKAEDLRTNGACEGVLAWSAPDIVVHLAAIYGRAQGELKPRTTVDVNTAVTADLAKATARRGVQMVYVSTSEVYGAGPDWRKPVTTNDATLPLNLYGWSKLWGEKAVEHYCELPLILRLNMPYGPGQKVAAVGYNALHTFLWLAHHRKPMTVHVGTWRTYTWAADTARAIRMLIESGLTGRFNVARRDDAWPSESVAALACTVAGMPLEQSGELAVFQAPPPDVTLVKTLDVERLYETGWEPTVGLEEGAKLTYDWVKTIPFREGVL